MAQNFFFRKPTVTAAILDLLGNHLDDISKDESAINNYTFTMIINGIVAVVSGGNLSSFSFNDFQTTDIAYLTGATVTMEGDYGSLMRFEVNAKISQNTFDDFDSAFLSVGADVTITFKGNDNANFSDLANTYQAKLYDFSWTINPDGTVDINMKAVGAGQGGMYVNMYEGASKAWAGKHYRADYDDDSGNLSPVVSIIDALDAQLQTDTGQLNTDDFGGNDACWPGRQMIRYNEKRGDELFKSEYAINQDLWFQENRGIYYTLGHLLNACNTQFSFAATPTQINFKAEANLKFKDIGYLPSANPIECIFAYKGNTGLNTNAYTKLGLSVGVHSLKRDGYNAMGTSYGQFDISNNLKDILINRDIIRGIFQEATSIKQSGNAVKFAGIEIPIPEYFLSIDTFFAKLFSIIKSNSGGAIDLILVPDPDATSSRAGYFLNIYNARGIESWQEPIIFKRGAIGIRDVKIVSKVPSATAMAAFGARGSSSDSDSEKAGKTIALPGSDAEDETVQGTGYPTTAEITDAMYTAQYSDFSASDVDALRGVIKRMIDNESVDETTKKTPIMWPIELKLTTVGVDGWRFGDTISYDGLPKRYRDARGTVKVAFTITRAVHTFGTEWTTELTSQCRFIGA